MDYFSRLLTGDVIMRRVYHFLDLVIRRMIILLVTRN